MFGKLLPTFIKPAFYLLSVTLLMAPNHAQAKCPESMPSFDTKPGDFMPIGGVYEMCVSGSPSLVSCHIRPIETGSSVQRSVRERVSLKMTINSAIIDVVRFTQGGDAGRSVTSNESLSSSQKGSTDKSDQQFSREEFINFEGRVISGIHIVHQGIRDNQSEACVAASTSSIEFAKALRDADTNR